MNLDSDVAIRLQFLARVVQKEREHLCFTDARLFTPQMTLAQVENLDADPDLAERVEAFASRFGRLQDTLGDKLLPMLLVGLGERAGVAIDNLDKAERLELIVSAENWMVMRNLRNRMVHEYIEDPVILHEALLAGHDFVPELSANVDRILGEIGRRGWLPVMDKEEKHDLT